MKRKKAPSKALRNNTLRVAKKYGAKKIRIFGSCARNERKRGSDIDLIVELPSKSTLLDHVGLKQDLQKALRCKVDVVTYTSIKPTLRSRILKEAIEL